MPHNRRRSPRVPVGFYVDQLVGEDTTHRCFTIDLSAHGLYMERPVTSRRRVPSVVQLELLLPETHDSIWAAGQVIYDRFDSLFHGTAVQFVAMADAHRRLLWQWLREARRAATMAPAESLARVARVQIHRPRSHAA